MDAALRTAEWQDAMLQVTTNLALIIIPDCAKFNQR